MASVTIKDKIRRPKGDKYAPSKQAEQNLSDNILGGYVTRDPARGTRTLTGSADPPLTSGPPLIPRTKSSVAGLIRGKAVAPPDARPRGKR